MIPKDLELLLPFKMNQGTRIPWDILMVLKLNRGIAFESDNAWGM
jgi:hypothetical protein